MIDWLLMPIDPSRPHDVGDLVSWHGRTMVLAWGFLVPLGVLIARFFKILPSQDWPRRLDNPVWWYSHLVLQYGGGLATVIGMVLILMVTGGNSVAQHATLGWIVVALAFSQFVAGWFRGTKGGPTDAHIRGDHFDMTPRRLAFEHIHKQLGYALLIVAAITLLNGMWSANAPVWMFAGLGVWWLVFLVSFAILQRRGLAFDTYQAIWGPDPALPGNQRRPIGWGVRRPDPNSGNGDSNVVF